MNTITIFDHNTHQSWNALYKSRHESVNRTNGGYTYSQDIVKYHVPVIKEILDNQTTYKNIFICSVQMPENELLIANPDLVICYLHESLQREYPRCMEFLSRYKGKTVFITSRANLCEKLNENGMTAILLPMAIDIQAIAKFAQSEKYADKRVIYFGNRYLGKGIGYESTKNSFLKKGWTFDTISNNKLNDVEGLTREQVLKTVAKYQYGIGEGRCVLEMNALGLKTLICASKNQGIFIDEIDFDMQKRNNFSDGKIWTFSPDINNCIEYFDKAIVKTVDIQDILPILKTELGRVICQSQKF